MTTSEIKRTRSDVEEDDRADRGDEHLAERDPQHGQSLRAPGPLTSAAHQPPKGADTMKKYVVEFKRSKVSYTAEKLESVARDHGYYGELRDSDRLAIAVKHFCCTHFMWEGAAHCESVDAETRGDLTQNWQYQPDGRFGGWINAVVDQG